MEFDLSSSQSDIQRTARELLAVRVTPERLRQAADERARDVDLWSELCELGWPGIAIDAEHGGAGLGCVELCVLLEEAGAALAPAPLLETACAAAVIARAGSPEQRERWLPELISGATGALGVTGRDGSTFVAGDETAAVLVRFDGHAAYLVGGPFPDAGVATIDRLRGYCMVTTDGEPLPGDGALAEAASAVAAIAVAAELTGVCQRALDKTVAYVKERRQFGVPIGSFQAVAHRCAEMLLATESARSATYYAAWTADARPEKLIEGAALAKLTASRAAVEVTSSAIQAHGGIGFTWEADLHWWYKRAQMSAQLLGGARQHRDRLAALIAEQYTQIADGARKTR
jgi:alkylation response protein AidB-like acyl-CoA dehydrogenase